MIAVIALYVKLTHGMPRRLRKRKAVVAPTKPKSGRRSTTVVRPKGKGERKPPIAKVTRKPTTSSDDDSEPVEVSTPEPEVAPEPVVKVVLDLSDTYHHELSVPEYTGFDEVEARIHAVIGKPTLQARTFYREGMSGDILYRSERKSGISSNVIALHGFVLTQDKIPPYRVRILRKVNDPPEPPNVFNRVVDQIIYQFTGRSYDVVYRITTHKALVIKELVLRGATAESYEDMREFIIQFNGGIGIATSRTWQWFLNSVPTTRTRQVARASVYPLNTFNPRLDPRYVGAKLDGQLCYLVLEGYAEGDRDPDSATARELWVNVYVYDWVRAGLLLIKKVQLVQAVPHVILVCERMHVGTPEEYFYAFDIIHHNDRKWKKIAEQSLVRRRKALGSYLQTYMSEPGVDSETQFAATRYYVGTRDRIEIQHRPFVKIMAENPVDHLEQLMAESRGSAEKTDGIVLTPLAPYTVMITSGDSRTMKLKDPKQTTIDLWIYNDALHWWNNRTYELYKPKRRIRVPDIPRKYSGHVVEMSIRELSGVSGFDFELVPIRIRADKGRKPNARRTVLSNERAAMHGSQLAQEFGLTPDRVYRINRAVIGMLNKPNRQANATYVIIGVGRFGSINQHRPGDRILGIDMNPDFIAEARKRASKMPNAYFIEAKVDWRDPNVLKGALETFRASDPEAWANLFGTVRVININLYHVLSFVPEEAELRGGVVDVYDLFFSQLHARFDLNGALVRYNILDFDKDAFASTESWSALGISINRNPDQTYRFNFPEGSIVGRQDNAHVFNFNRLTSSSFWLKVANVDDPVRIEDLMTTGAGLRSVTPFAHLSQAEREYLAFMRFGTYVRP